MDAYVYQAALICAPCGESSEFRCRLIAEGHNPEQDSDFWPHGPYSNGGGEADTPQHCDFCGEFLENPLTQDGYAYLAEAVGEHVPNYESMDWREAVEALKAVGENARNQLALNLPGDDTHWKHVAHSSGVVADWVSYYEPWDWKTG